MIGTYARGVRSQADRDLTGGTSSYLLRIPLLAGKVLVLGALPFLAIVAAFGAAAAFAHQRKKP